MNVLTLQPDGSYVVEPPRPPLTTRDTRAATVRTLALLCDVRESTIEDLAFVANLAALISSRAQV